jgi:signal transduction histidine kinase
MGETVAHSVILEGSAAKGVQYVAERLSHDFGNLLMPLLEYPQLIKMDLQPDAARAVGLLDCIVRTARDIEHISRQMAALTVDPTEPAPVDLNRVAKEVVQGVRACGQTGGFDIRFDLCRDLPVARGVEAQLVRAVENLVLNGLEALTKEGDAVTLSSGVCEHGTWSVPAVRLSVADTGGGVDPSVAATMFDPFVTTKKRGYAKRGAGLGLSIAFLAARAHGGEIRFDSAPGRGACFSLLLPAGGS